MSTEEAPFPPRDWRDVWAYPEDDVVAGFREHRAGDPEPGPNRSPGYRWGWANRRSSHEPDGMDHIRRNYIHATRHDWPFANSARPQ